MRAMEVVDCDLAGEEDVGMELGSFEGMREVLAGVEGAEV